MRESSIRLLVVYAGYTDRLSYYDDWLDAFRYYPTFRTSTFSVALSGGEALLREMLASTDAVVILHSANGDTTVYLEPYAAVLRDRKVPLLSFVGNEVNLPGSPISEKRRVLAIIRPTGSRRNCSKTLGKCFSATSPHVVWFRYRTRLIHLPFT